MSGVLGAEMQFYQDPERFPYEESLQMFLDQFIARLKAGDPEGDQDR